MKFRHSARGRGPLFIAGGLFALGLALFGFDFFAAEPSRSVSGDTALARPSGAVPSKRQVSQSSDRSRHSLSQREMDSLAATLGLAADEPDEIRRRRILEDYAFSLSSNEIPATLAALLGDERSGSERSLAMALIRVWSTINPRAAAEWAAHLPPDDPFREILLTTASIAWTNRGLAEPAAWATQLSGKSSRQIALAAVSAEAVRSDPPQAARLVLALDPDHPQRAELARHAVMEWALSDPSAAAAWARDWPDSSGRESLASAISIAWSEKDPAAAAAFALDEVAGEKLRYDTIVSVVQRWAQSDLSAAEAWVSAFPEGALKRDAYEALEALSRISAEVSK